jgi:hypothetical protein
MSLSFWRRAALLAMSSITDTDQGFRLALHQKSGALSWRLTMEVVLHLEFPNQLVEFTRQTREFRGGGF